MSNENVKKCRFAWFHISAEDIQRAQKFYNKVFGWEFEEIEKANQAWTIKGCEPKGREDYRLHQRRYPGQTVTSGILVPSAKEYAEKVRKFGGKIFQMLSIPNVGYFAICQDTEGNIITLWEDFSIDK